MTNTYAKRGMYPKPHVHNPCVHTPVLRVVELEERLGTNPKPPVTEELSPGAIEARRILEIAQRKFKEQQEQTAMPDITSEMKKVLAQWDDTPAPAPAPAPAPEPAPTPATHRNGTKFAPTNNISRESFAFIQANKDKYTAAQAARILESRGFRYASSTSLMSSMLRTGMIGRNSNGTLYAIADSYSSSTLNKARSPKRAPAVKAHTVRASKKTEWKPPELLPMPPVAPAPVAHVPSAAPLTAQAALKMMSVSEAHDLYLELRKMFGGSQ